MQQTVAQLSATQRWDAIVAVQTPVAQYARQAGSAPRIIDVDTSFSYQMHERCLTHSHSAFERVRNWVSWQKAHWYETRMFRRFRVCTLAATIESPFVSAMVQPSNTSVEVIPNGVDCGHNLPGLAPVDATALVFNGAMTYSANFDAMRYFLAEIYPGIRQLIGNVSLTITGNTTGVRLADLQFDDSVQLSGYVDDIRPVIARAAVCVVPLRQGSGTRLKILEAMALGTPVVATSKGAEGLDITPGHDILIADEPEEFAHQVIRLLRDAALRTHLADNARRLVEQRYDWQQIGRDFVDLMEAAAGERSVGTA
jgi:glycosyltransferase involved in cell wall biosynthesis